MAPVLGLARSMDPSCMPSIMSRSVPSWAFGEDLDLKAALAELIGGLGERDRPLVVRALLAQRGGVPQGDDASLSVGGAASVTGWAEGQADQDRHEYENSNTEVVCAHVGLLLCWLSWNRLASTRSVAAGNGG